MLHTAKAAILDGLRTDLRVRAGIAPRKSFRAPNVIQLLKGGNDPEVVEIGDELGSFKVRRERADYDLWRAFNRKNAEDAVDHARKMCDTIEGLTAQRIGRSVAHYVETVYR